MQITSKLYYMIVKSAAKVQQKTHIRKKINEKTRIIYKSQQYRQCISNNEDNKKG
jgi:hypothetical protein